MSPQRVCTELAKQDQTYLVSGWSKGLSLNMMVSSLNFLLSEDVMLSRTATYKVFLKL